jgi:hypothetical protein
MYSQQIDTRVIKVVRNCRERAFYVRCIYCSRRSFVHEKVCFDICTMRMILRRVDCSFENCVTECLQLCRSVLVCYKSNGETDNKYKDFRVKEPSFLQQWTERLCAVKNVKC